MFATSTAGAGAEIFVSATSFLAISIVTFGAASGANIPAGACILNFSTISAAGACMLTFSSFLGVLLLRAMSIQSVRSTFERGVIINARKA